MFKVPENYRVTKSDNTLLVTTSRHGNNGLFFIPHQSFILRAIASDGEGWEHVSVSLPGRCPNWNEMCRVKGLFWGEEDTVVQFHPPKSEYVNHHPFCLHMWRHPETNWDLPPTYMVGPKS